jgi:hypothetical protein
MISVEICQFKSANQLLLTKCQCDLFRGTARSSSHVFATCLITLAKCLKKKKTTTKTCQLKLPFLFQKVHIEHKLSHVCYVYI